jgi:NAD(P)-dependent dehydrogenase (short-subunit alcohol dehydrogenase family)
MDLQTLPDLTGRVYLVTGANSGIGKAAARMLAQRGGHVVMACRSEARGRQAQEDIQAEAGTDAVDLVLGDLAALDSVRDLARTVLERYDRLDVLVNNAGIYEATPTLTDDGFEKTFAVNHFGPFLLTNLLLDRITATAAETGDGRIVNVSSDAHRGAQLDFDALTSTDGYRAMQAYGRTKLANILFTLELARRLRGTNVTTNAVHPGVVATNFWNHNDDWLSWVAGLFAWLYKSPDQGAEGPVYLAAADAVADVTGSYFSGTERAEPSAAALDEKTAQRLWHVSEELTGLATAEAETPSDPSEAEA